MHDDITPVDAAMLAHLRADGRVQLVEGDAQEIVPGIRVFTGGRHTYASQYAAVNTRVGPVVIASDNVYLYENLDRHVPIGTTFDAQANLAALRVGPYRVFFYSSDRGEIPHVHIGREARTAKFWLAPVRLERSGGFGRLEIRHQRR